MRLLRRCGLRLVVAIPTLVGVMFPATSIGATIDGRGYELVSPSAKDQAGIGSTPIAPDGRNVLLVLGPAAEDRFLVSTRSETGGVTAQWQQSSLAPPREQQVSSGVYSLLAASRDRKHEIVGVQAGFLKDTPVTFVRLSVGGPQEILSTVPSAAGDEMVMSDDGAHAFASIGIALDGEHLPGTRNVYDLGTVPPVLVSRLSDGTVPVCGVGGNGFAGQLRQSTDRQRWSSQDGSKVFFLSRGSGDCVHDPLRLYLRDLLTSTTTTISGPPLSGAESDATFLQASPDASVAVFVTAAQLEVNDLNTHPDVYRWMDGRGTTCLTCVVPDAAVKSVFGDSSRTVGVSEDLSHIFFVSDGNLAPGGRSGEDNLYVLNQNLIQYISPISLTTTSVTNNPSGDPGAAMTPDGSVLVFSSDLPAMDTISDSRNGGLRQYYRYSDVTKDVVCVSCPTGRPATVAVAPSMATGQAGNDGYVQVLSDAGDRFFFRSSEPLDRSDINLGADLYEWHAGRVGLITDGSSDAGSEQRPSVALRGISADGNDVFFSSYAKLTSGATDGSQQLYDARVGGGEPTLGPGSAACAGDACRGTPRPAPELGTIGSATVNESERADHRQSFTVKQLTARQRAALVHKGKTVVAVRLRIASRVSIVARAYIDGRMQKVAQASRRARSAETITLPLQLSGAARRSLAFRGMLRISLSVSVAVTGETKAVTFVLRARNGEAAVAGGER